MAWVMANIMVKEVALTSPQLYIISPFKFQTQQQVKPMFSDFNKLYSSPALLIEDAAEYYYLDS